MPQKLMMVSLLWVLVYGAYGGTFVCASQSATDEARFALMDQEMNCLAKHVNSNNEVTWQNTCTDHYARDEYPIAQAETSDKYYAPHQSVDDSQLKDIYDFAQIDKGDSDTDYMSGNMGAEPLWDQEEARPLQAELQILGGYRFDDFNWNIASDITGSATPDILSELTWSDLKMTQIKAEGEIVFLGHFVLDGSGSYADIYDGDNQDSDYLGNDRTLEFSRSNNKSDDGESLGWSAGGGLRLPLGSEPMLLGAEDIALTVLGGYAHNELNLIITDGFQTIPATGSFAGLHSSYWAEWEGPWAGVELKGSMKRLLGAFRFEYHWANYNGSANWNLRADFQHPKSFEHEADGRGLVFNLSTSYKLTENFALDFQADIMDWKATGGIDRTFFSSGATSETRFNEVNWESLSFMLGSSYRF